MLLKLFQSLLFIIDPTVKLPPIDASSKFTSEVMVSTTQKHDTCYNNCAKSCALIGRVVGSYDLGGVDQLRSQVLSLPPEERRPYSDINDGKILFLSVFLFSVSRARFLEKRRPEMDVGNGQG